MPPPPHRRYPTPGTRESPGVRTPSQRRPESTGACPALACHAPPAVAKRSYAYRLLRRPAICLRSTVGKRGQARANLPLAVEVELRNDVTRAVGSLREYHAPRIYDHRAPT